MLFRSYEAAFVFAGVRGLRQWLYGMYFQDDWRVTPRLTLNLGLRYEFTTVPTEAFGRLANLRGQYDKQVVVGDPLWENPSLKNFAPRIGFAYDPFGDGKTSIRGGGGIFYDQLLPLYYRDSPFRILPFQQRIFVTPQNLATALNVPQGTPVIPFPNAHTFYTPQQRLSDPAVQIDLMNYRPHQPYTTQYNLTIQRYNENSDGIQAVLTNRADLNMAALQVAKYAAARQPRLDAKLEILDGSRFGFALRKESAE